MVWNFEISIWPSTCAGLTCGYSVNRMMSRSMPAFWASSAKTLQAFWSASVVPIFTVTLSPSPLPVDDSVSDEQATSPVVAMSEAAAAARTRLVRMCVLLLLSWVFSETYLFWRRSRISLSSA